MPARRFLVALSLGAAICLGACSPSGEGQNAAPAATTTASAVVSAEAKAAPPTATASGEAAPPPASAGHPRAIDMHCDTPYQVKTKGRSLALDTGHITPDTLRRGRVGGVFFAIYIADDLHDHHPTIADADAVVETIDQILARHTDILWPEAKGPTPEGKVTAYLSIEGAGPFADDVTQIDRFIARGVRLIGPVHMHNGPLATSSTEKHTGGLTALGKNFCERVYRKGALIDVSHMSDESFQDVVALAARFHAPIVASHSSARAIAAHPRNLTDAQLRAVARSGGVVGVNFYAGYLKIGAEATLADAVKHAKHMVEVAGVDHVGIGSDFDGSATPKDLADASYLPAFAAALQEAGIEAADVHKIFSENVKRVLSWKPGPEITGPR
jgi:membrane dipeptidase